MQVRNQMGQCLSFGPFPLDQWYFSSQSSLRWYYCCREDKPGTPTPEVDDEGYNVRPKSDTWENDKGSFYSSSDSDSGNYVPAFIYSIRC